jgi:hypothetical protein
MALLSYKQLEKIIKSKNSVHKPVQGTYLIFSDSTGKKYFQIDTYGSEEREYPNKISQSLQFDEETVRYIVRLLKKEFDIEEL